MKRYDNVGNFKEGLCKVELAGKFGFIDLRGVEIIPCIYISATDFENGTSAVCADDEYFYIDFRGDRIDINPGESELEQIYSNDFFDEDFDLGYNDIKIASSRYDTIKGLDVGLVEVSKNNLYGFIDLSGKEVIPCIYRFVGEFTEGLCDIIIEDENSKEVFGFLDVTGKKMIDFMYDDTNGFSEGLAGVKLNNKWGFIDKFNNVIIDFIFDDVEYFSEGKCIVRKDIESFFINIKGEKLF
jgi:hypothetical protein